MAFYAILRRTASSVAPHAIRALGFQRSHQRLLSSALSRTIISGEVRRSTFAQTLNFSSKPSSDENLLKVIDYEIKCALESDDQDQVDEVPDGFPFEIQDNAGERTISLVRDYKGETIKVEVHMPDLVTGEGGDDDQDDDENASDRSSIPLVVNISKNKGPALEFGVTAFPDEIAIDSLSVKEPDSSDELIAYEGPDFGSLDENLQKAFHKYLEIRGIKPSTTNFLHEYMINKDSREYLKWLENLKHFIAK